MIPYEYHPMASPSPMRPEFVTMVCSIQLLHRILIFLTIVGDATSMKHEKKWKGYLTNA